MLYYRPSTWGPLTIDGEHVPIPGEVIAHFRDVKRICALCESPRVEVIGAHMRDRSSYHQNVLQTIRQREAEIKSIVFLDPDTGLQPSGKADFEHVTNAEAAAIWAALRPGDMFVLYQHQTNRNGSPWIEPKRQQLATALGVPEAFVKIASGPLIANDVVLFFVNADRA